MSYKLKENIEEFQVVDGPFAGRRYKHGVEYAEIPAQDAHKFEAVNYGHSHTANLAQGSEVKRKLKTQSTRKTTHKTVNSY